jgi:hypothetical protein
MSEPKRNPERVLAAIKAKLEQYPDLRVGQLLVNVAGIDPFYTEDDRLADLIELYPYAAAAWTKHEEEKVG